MVAIIGLTWVLGSICVICIISTAEEESMHQIVRD